ncbi:MAG TPA: right-handed parallel beta-helix repeat-containing protein [Gammaproteobacteria bacterium]
MRGRWTPHPIHLLLVVSLALGSAAQAATYYVRNGGNDGADGLSHETAWATVQKVNSFSFAPGDSVLFHEGDVFTGRTLVVDWNGTSSQQAIVGAYYVENGQAKRGLRPGNPQRPTFDGQRTFPAGRYDPMIHVTGDYVRLENVAVVDSQGRGIVFSECKSSQVVGTVVRSPYDGGIAFTDCDDGLIENNEVTDSDRGWFADRKGNWGAAIGVNRGSTRITIRGNRIHKVFGEGINVFQGSADAVIENNYVFAARAVGIYADAAPNPIIRRNMVVGTPDSKYWRSKTSVGAGIVLSNEAYHYEKLDTSVQSKNARIYGNLVAYTHQGIGLWGELEATSFDNTLIYNNTLVDNEVQFNSLGRPMPNSKFVNNILYSASAGAVDIKGAFPGLEASHNYFSQGDPGEPFSDSGNRYSGLQLTKMTGWREITSLDQVSPLHFQPTPASSTNGAGTDGFSALAALTGLADIDLDFNSKPFGVPVDLGALRKSSGKVPKNPVLTGASTE